MTARLPRIALLCSAWAHLISGQSPPPVPSPAEREVRWREDLRFLVDGYSAPGTTVDLQRGITTRGQKDFAILYPKATFEPAVEELMAGASRLSDGEMVLGVMRLVASARVAHNTVHLPLSMGFFPRLPLTFQWYRDGLAIVSAAPEYSAAIGKRVLSFGGMAPDQLLKAVAPYISHENDVWLRRMAVEFIRPRAVLQHLGLLGADGRLAITLEERGGSPFTVAVAPADPRTKRLPPDAPMPLYRSQYMADSATMYIQYNACRNDPKLPFAEFARQALAEIDSHPVRRVVIDLRQNGGGDSRIIGPLIDGLASRLKAIGGVYVLVGPGTFSSAIDNAVTLRKRLRATLAGEPAGGTVSGYGEVKFLTLPHSKLVVTFTSKHFGNAKNADPTGLEPEINIPLLLEDAVAGRDPVLERVLALPR